MSHEGAGLAEVFAVAGCRGSVHATTLDGQVEVGLDADELVAPASVIKVLVAITAETQMADGRLDPTRRVRIADPSGVPGPVGMSLFQDAVEVSARDLVVPMLTISDNVATDALLELVGLDDVNRTADRLGLAHTHLGSTLRDLVDSVAVDAGFADWAAFLAWHRAGPSSQEVRSAQQRIADAGALRPGSATRTSPRDMTRLLRTIWTDTAGPARACARVRDLMARQLTRHRIAGGFGPGVGVAAKSGALLGVVRNEVGVVSFPDEPPYVLAVFTSVDGPWVDERPVNHAVGRAAEVAVAQLRSAGR